MDWLGVEIDVTTTAPVAICLVGGCDWRWDGEGDRAAVIEEHRLDEHDYIPRSRFSVRTQMNGVDGYDELDQAVLESRDCAAPRCDREADSGSDFCRVCDEGLRLVAERAGHVIEAPLDAFADRAREPKPEEEVETVPTAPRTWTREKVIEAIKRFHAEHGRPPTQKDWVRRGDWWPAFSTAARPFGSWGAAIVAAGYVSAKPGGPKRSPVREPKGREAAVVLTGAPPAASSSSPLPESDAAVVDESPSPVAAEAGPRTGEDYIASLGIDLERLQAEIDRQNEISIEAQGRRDALKAIVDALEYI